MIRLIKPYIEFADVQADFQKIFDSGTFTQGEYAMRLPQKISEYTGAGFTFNASSATTALSACLDILSVGRGDEVIVADFSFPATVNVVEAVGAKPVFADVDSKTYNLLAEQVEEKITSKTKAVIFVCALGNPDGLMAVKGVCARHGIPLINDAACAIGSEEAGVKVGNIADLACFSFHPRKLLTGGEGGAITTNNPEYARQLEVKLLHGGIKKDGLMDFVTYGFNFRLPDLQCAMLLHQLENLDEIVRERNATQADYRHALEPMGFAAQQHGSGIVHNMQSVVFTVPSGTSRDGLMAHLRKEGIESTIGTYCLSGCRYYKEQYDDVQPTARWLQDNTITLPCYRGVETGKVVQAIEGYLGQ